MRRVVFRVANAADRSRPVLAKHVTRRALSQSGGYGLPGVVLLSEVSRVDVAAVAGAELAVVQFGAPRSGPDAGVALAVRVPALVSRVRYEVGSRAPLEGGGIRVRPVVSARVRVPGTRGRRVWSGHAPPDRAPSARAEFLAAAERLGGILGGDLNVTPKTLQTTWTRRVVGVGVLALAVPRWMRVGVPLPVDVGSDHAAFDVPVWLP